ncbi:MAG: deoxynucleoside kinase [Chloroflexi bacterium]|nr:deoxynucleoside kinase [Chloroflexota bacterium]OQB02056.1 MAG: Deoxyadenosine/deoxycytidine kinase [Chloroflexi bacterium ADurb.Bin222]HOC21258.1 deoxynucleoside kinase [Anaerolineae bacterium]HQM14210.1 deoxynucleoside kinase [Anaerolineae bacterium]
MKKYYIAIAGNIGAGKTTLTTMLSRRLGWEPFLEGVTDNPYLADFYENMEKWSFHSQVFFLARRLRHHRELLDRPNSVIQDRTVYEDAEIFAQNLFLRGAMQLRDFNTYRDLYEAVTAILPPPDLVIYLRASLPTLLERIQHRGRSFERQIAPEYIAQLNTLYEAWFQSFTLCPILTVPADRLDFVANGGHLDLIVERILERLQGKEFVTFD